MEKARRQIATLVRECNTLLEILNELDYDRYFRGLMRVLSDEALSHLVRDDAALIRITDYTREKLADWHLPQWICSPDEQPLIVRACVRLEQLHPRRAGGRPSSISVRSPVLLPRACRLPQEVAPPVRLSSGSAVPQRWSNNQSPYERATAMDRGLLADAIPDLAEGPAHTV